MSCFTAKYNPAIGPVGRVGIRTAGRGQPATDSRPVKWIDALYDSGAEKTSLLRGIAESINLVPVGKVEITSAIGVAPVNQYHLDLLIQFDRPGRPEKDEIAIAGIRVAEYDSGGRHFQMLLGRDVLKHGVFQMDGINQSFMFCI